MKKVSFLAWLLGYACTHMSFAQDVTINYETWNPSNPPCNLFATATNVPATINNVPGTIEHQKLAGQSQYINAGQYLLLPVASGSSTEFLGTKIRIAYNFKKGYRYQITVHSTASSVANGGPYLRLDFSNTGGGGGTACTGPGSVDPDGSGTPSPIQYLNTTYQNYVFPFTNYYSTAYSQLILTAIPVAGGGSNGVRIKTIVIDESLVPPSFSLTPGGTTNITCGSTSNIDFTVNNANFTPVTGYTWNLGSTPNGWLWNNAPAPATISTTTNTLTLKPACQTTHKPITVTVAGAGGSYSTNTAQFANVAPIWVVVGDPAICTGSKTYTVNPLPCGTTVSWASSNTSVATVSSANNVATLTKVGSGTTRLTATITSPCGNTSRFLDVGVGAPTPSLSYVKETGSQTMYIFTATGSSPALGYDWYVNNVRIRQNADAVTYLEIPCGQTKTVKCNQTTACGTSQFSNSITVPNFCPPSFTASPNPADDVITIEEIAGDDLRSSQQVAAAGITEVKIFDQAGNVKKTFRFEGKSKKVQINVSELRGGIYFAEVTKGSVRERIKLSIR